MLGRVSFQPDPTLMVRWVWSHAYSEQDRFGIFKVNRLPVGADQPYCRQFMSGQIFPKLMLLPSLSTVPSLCLFVVYIGFLSSIKKGSMPLILKAYLVGQSFIDVNLLIIFRYIM